MMEAVELLGGPADGTHLVVKHGNVIRMARMPAATLRIDGFPPQPLAIEEAIYERSARNPKRFVFRPTHRDGVEVTATR